MATDDELIERAERAYLQHVSGADYPSRYDSSITWQPDGSAAVTLANGNGILATYAYDPKRDRLFRLVFDKEK